MSESEYWRAREADAIKLAQYYERVPEDEQKAAGARTARREAEFARKMAEEAERRNAE